MVSSVEPFIRFDEPFYEPLTPQPLSLKGRGEQEGVCWNYLLLMLIDAIALPRFN
jgi:hypothetical protein